MLYCTDRDETSEARRSGSALLLTDSWKEERRTLAAFIDTMLDLFPGVARVTVARAVDQDLDMIYAEWNEKRTRHRLLYDDAMSPLDYEHFCARRLESYGWKAEVTRASRDQGADIVASSGGIRAVIQAKKYRSRVGNDAVQQIYAAMRYYDAVPAAVVSTADFTASARVLARSTGVLLLHHDQLSNLQPQARMGLAPESPPTLRPALWNQPNAERRKR